MSTHIDNFEETKNIFSEGDGNIILKIDNVKLPRKFIYEIEMDNKCFVDGVLTI